MRTKRAGQSALLLLDAVEIPEREKFDYAVIGAFALSAHGVVRASTDVGVLLFTTPLHLAKLRARFRRAGFGTELRRGEADDPIPAMLILSDSHNNHVHSSAGPARQVLAERPAGLHIRTARPSRCQSKCRGPARH